MVAHVISNFGTIYCSPSLKAHDNIIKLYHSETSILKCMDCPYLRTTVSHALNSLMVLHIHTDETEFIQVQLQINLLVVEKVDLDHF